MGASGNTSTVTTETDPWVKSQTQDLYGSALRYLQNSPYQAYGGPQVAGFQPMQTAAMNYLTQGLMGPGANLGFAAPQLGGPYGAPNVTFGYTAPGGTNPGGQTTTTSHQPGVGTSTATVTGRYGPTEYVQPMQGLPMADQNPQAQAYADWQRQVGPQGAQEARAAFEAEFGRPPEGPADYINFLMTSGRMPETQAVRSDGTAGSGTQTAPTGAGAGNFQNVGQAASSQATGIAQDQLGPVSLGNYRNMFESQVVNNALGDIERSRQMANAGGARSAGASTYGGDRNALIEAETNRGYADAAARTAAQLRSAGFDTSAALAQNDATRGLQAAGLINQFGQDAFGNLLSGANALSAFGNQQQNQAQNMINADMNQFNEARNDPLRGFGLLQGILTGMPVGMNQTYTQPGGSAAAGFGGGALAGAGLGSTFGPWGALAGGGIGGLLGLLR